MDTEIFRMLADASLGDPALTDSLFPPYDPTAPVITPTGHGRCRRRRRHGNGGRRNDCHRPNDARPVRRRPSAPPRAWRELAATGSGIMALAGLDHGSGLVGDHGIGSNDWVVAGSQSATGGALLANDPHLGFSQPSVWIMNGLHCRTVVGRLPVRRRRRLVPGRPGGRPRAQRPDRLGRDERRAGRPGPLSAKRSIRTTRRTTCTRASPSRSRRGRRSSTSRAAPR